MIGVEHCVLDPSPVACWRPWIEHLKRVTARPECFRKRPLNSCSLGNGRRRLHRAHRFLPTDWCSEFLRGSSRHQRCQDCDHQCLHVSLSFEACNRLTSLNPKSQTPNPKEFSKSRSKSQNSNSRPCLSNAFHLIIGIFLKIGAWDLSIPPYSSGVALNHACTQYIFRWILLKRPHASWI